MERSVGDPSLWSRRLSTFVRAYVLLALVAVFWSGFRADWYRQTMVGPWYPVGKLAQAFFASRGGPPDNSAVVVRVDGQLRVLLARERTDELAAVYNANPSPILAELDWRPRRSSVGLLAPWFITMSTRVVVEADGLNGPELTSGERAEVRRKYVESIARWANGRWSPDLLAAIGAGDGGFTRLNSWGVVCDFVAVVVALVLAHRLPWVDASPNDTHE